MTSLFVGGNTHEADIPLSSDGVYTITISMDTNIPLTVSAQEGDIQYWLATIAPVLSRKRAGQFEWVISISRNTELPNDIASYLLVITVEGHLNEFQITDTIGLRINVPDAFSCKTDINLKIVNEVVLDGTRAGSVVADLGYLVAYHRANDLKMTPEFSPFTLDTIGVIKTNRDLRVASLTVKGALYSYSFNVTGYVNGESELRTLANIKLTVIVDQLNLYIQESEPTNSLLATFGDNFVSSMVLPSVVNSTGKELVLRENLDYERETEYRFSITIDTGTRDINMPVTIHVLDTNDNRPTFLDESISWLAFEGAPVGTVVGIVRTEDKDASSEVTYELTNHTSRFTIDSVGAVIAYAPINRNGSDVISLGIDISDGNYVTKIFADLEIVNLDPNQANLGQVFSGNVLENKGRDTFVAVAMNASYDDFRFVGNNRDTARFSLNSTTGRIVTTEVLDREETASYRFSIRGVFKDDFVCSITIIGDITITVNDVNDNPPVFGRSGYSGSVLEESDAGTTVSMAPLETTDKDEGVNAQSTFRIISGSNGMFDIGRETGIITLLQAPDRETKATYTLVVQADDKGTPPESATTTVVISILDINDHNPRVTSLFTSVRVLENITMDEVIETITAADDDAGANGEIYFSLYAASGGHYGIDVDSGDLRATGELDRESSNTNVLEIAITDKGNPPLNVTLTITIILLDVNDNNPTFVHPGTLSDVFVYEFLVSENSNVGDAIGFVSATDPDQGDNGDVTYSIVPLRSPISVDSNSGQLRLATLLDYETRTSHSITVRATDNGQNPRTADIDVILTVEDYNDNGPVFSSDEYTANFVKTSNIDRALVTAIEVQEDDTGINGQITLSIMNNDNFNISQQGVIFVISVETLEVGVVNLTVLAKDRGDPPKTATTQVVVTVSLGSDTSNLINSDIRFNVLENTTYSTALHTVENLSVIQRTVSYAIVVDNFNGLFTINSSTGDIFLSADETVDRETKDEYLLVIRARDVNDNGISDLALVTITVLDINDNPPEFPTSESILMMEVLENVANGTVVGTVDASDRDIGDNGRIKYSLINPEGFPFAIRSDGSVYVTGEVDRESRMNSDYLYDFDIMVEDNGSPRLSATKMVHVHVFDVNDNIPTFIRDSPVIITLRENAPLSSVDTLFVTDADLGVNGTVTFRILSTNPPCPLTTLLADSAEIENLNKKCTLILFRPLDYEQSMVHTCILEASDMAVKGSPLSSTINITILVEDFNDNSPQFEGSYDNINVSRQHLMSTGIVQVNATDEDTGLNANIIFTLDTQSEYAEYFYIDPLTGILSLNKSLMTLQEDDISVPVFATDEGIPARSSQISVTLFILDGNIRPFFASTNRAFTIREEDPRRPLGFIEATDRVGGSDVVCNCTYRLNDTTVFEIGRRTGVITQKVRVDREVTGSIIDLMVTATDEELQDGNLLVRVEIVDINDHGPKLTKDSYAFPIGQNMNLGSRVSQIVATDDDLGENAITEYFLDSADQQPWFSINSTTGEIFVSHEITVTEGIEARVVIMNLKAVDSTMSAFTDSALVSFNISYRDPNPNAPVWLRDVYSATVPRDYDQKNPIKFNEIEEFGATDVESQQLTYSILSGNKRDLFGINADAGSLSLQYWVLNEVDNLTLTITATDRGIKPRKSSCEVRVTFSGNSPYIDSATADQQVTPWRSATITLVVFCIIFVAVFIVILALRMCRRAKKEQSPEACPRNSEPVPDYLTASAGHAAPKRTEYTKPMSRGEDFENPGYAALHRRDPFARQAEDIKLIDRENMLLHGLSNSQVDNNTWT